MSLDLDKLESVARDATPGPWVVEPYNTHDLYGVISTNSLIPGHHRYDLTDDLTKPNAIHIATFNPETVLQMIAELRRYAEKFAQMHELVATRLWFDASIKGSGCCMYCEANMHDNCMGFHAQLNGDPCPIQILYDETKS